MVAKLIMKIADYCITQDEIGQYHLLDNHAQVVGAGPSLEAMTQLGRLMTRTTELGPDGLCDCQSCKDGRLIARMADKLAAASRKIADLEERCKDLIGGNAR